MRPQFFSTTLTLSPKKTASTSITLLPASPESQSSTIKNDKKTLKATTPKTLNDLPIRLMPLIFQSLDRASIITLAQTNRRMYVAYKACTISIAPTLPSNMWDTYADIGKVRRMILDGDEDQEVKKMLMEYKSRLVRDRIREERGWNDKELTGCRIVYEERRAVQWGKIQKRLMRAEKREQERVEMQLLVKAAEEEKSKKMSVGRVFAWFARG